jgi:DNA polymerase I-like protein with 3'-5' exonuclease and polymerase domains
LELYMGFGFWTFQTKRTFRSESAAWFEAYYQSYPIKVIHRNQVDFADHGYVQTVLGRRRYLKISTPKMPLYEVVQSVMP